MYVQNLDIALGKLRLFKEKEDGKFFILTFGVYKNFIRAYIRSGDGASNAKTTFISSVVIPPINLRIYIKYMRRLLAKKEDWSYEVNLLSPKWEDDKMLKDEKEFAGVAGVSKVTNDKGDRINYVDITTKDEEKFSFPLIPTPYVQFKENGKFITDATELSDTWFDGYIDIISDILKLVPESYTKKITKNKYVDIDKELDKV